MAYNLLDPLFYIKNIYQLLLTVEYAMKKNVTIR